MTRTALIPLAGLLILSSLSAAQASVQVEPAHLDGPRTLADQTAKAVVDNYIESWKTLNTALDTNRIDLLDRDFVGSARDKIAETIQQQMKLGLHTSYLDKSHHVQITFYSPEGLSIELTDTVEYDQQVVDHDKVISTQHLSTRYVVVLTPSETRWRVRVYQAVTD